MVYLFKYTNSLVIRKPVNTCEGDFYANMHKYVGRASRFFPEFFGIVQVSPDTPAYIFMEDATSGCKKPAVLDIKIGFIFLVDFFFVITFSYG